jgi:hypothetical protein
VSSFYNYAKCSAAASSCVVRNLSIFDLTKT